MKKNLFYITFVILFLINISYAQSTPPKFEFRGAWVASVSNLDWPTSPNLSTDQKKAKLIQLFDDLKAAGVNAIIFQVRTECDALYNSKYDPWSYWLTGRQGQAPSPYFDPLKFAVEEAHKRGMELHAWINPYRAIKSVGEYSIASNHVTKLHPDWILTFDNGKLKILNPGLQEVRDYVTNVIMDIVKNYDVDGVHFDDYFYPYSGITNEDANTFKDYPRGFSNIGDWRRDNINIFVKEVYDSIQVAKPYVKFGISPFGIWKNGVPSGIVGLDAYNVLYADAVAWLQNKIVDYITPQLYWPFGGGQDYGKLMPWWASQAGTNGRHFYPGEAGYRIVNWSSSSEMPRHIRLGRSNQYCQGNVYFRALVGILDNEKGFLDTLKNDLYRYPALTPRMDWKDTLKPNAPSNLRFEKLASSGVTGLTWDLPNVASDGDTASRYVVYRFDNSNIQSSDINDPSRILNIVGTREEIPTVSSTTSGKVYFAVTSVDHNSNESTLSNLVEVNAPGKPTLSIPQKYAVNQKDTVKLEWNYTADASIYQLQVSTDSTFNSGIINRSIRVI